MIRKLAQLAKSNDPFERSIAECLFERFQRKSEAERWWETAVLIHANVAKNDVFDFRPAEQSAMEYLRLECAVARKLEERGWRRQPDGTVVPPPDQPDGTTK